MSIADTHTHTHTTSAINCVCVRQGWGERERRRGVEKGEGRNVSRAKMLILLKPFINKPT